MIDLQTDEGTTCTIEVQVQRYSKPLSAWLVIFEQKSSKAGSKLAERMCIARRATLLQRHSGEELRIVKRTITETVEEIES